MKLESRTTLPTITKQEVLFLKLYKLSFSPFVFLQVVVRHFE